MIVMGRPLQDNKMYRVKVKHDPKPFTILFNQFRILDLFLYNLYP